MSPLAAIRQWVTPEIRPAISPQSLGGTTSVGAIPTAELSTLSPSAAPASLDSLKPVESTNSFGNVLGQFVEDVNTKQAVAGDNVNQMLSGQNVSLHQAMVSMEEASVSFQLMVEVRNKLLDSYQELMRMQV